jgi:hypothetical protein
MSDPELHEITFNRAKEEPVSASFPGVVLLFYQNNLWTASTKIVPASLHSPGSDLPQVSRDRVGCFGWEVGCRGTERFQSEAFSGTAEGAE